MHTSTKNRATVARYRRAPSRTLPHHRKRPAELAAFMAQRAAALLALVGTDDAQPADVVRAARARGVSVPSTDTIARYLRAHRQVTA